MGCRTLCLGEYYGTATRPGQHCDVDFAWAETGKRGINASRYRVWGVSGYRRPRGAPGVTLSGEAARVNGSCATTVDLRNAGTWTAFNLTQCMACIVEAKKRKRPHG